MKISAALILRAGALGFAIGVAGLVAPSAAKDIGPTSTAKSFVASLGVDGARYLDFNADGQIDVVARHECGARVCTFRFYLAQRGNAWRLLGSARGKSVVVGSGRAAGFRNLRVLTHYLSPPGNSRRIVGAVSQVLEWNGAIYRQAHLRVKAIDRAAKQAGPVMPILPAGSKAAVCMEGSPRPMTVSNTGDLYRVLGRIAQTGMLVVETADGFASLYPGSRTRMRLC